MSKVWVNIGLSLDGYMAPEGMAVEHWDTPQYKNWGGKRGAPLAARGALSHALALRAPMRPG